MKIEFTTELNFWEVSLANIGLLRYVITSSSSSSVGWSCEPHSNECSRYEIKVSDGEPPALEI